LTRREKEILKEIARGATSKEIASQLQISFRTVQTHRSNIMEKLQLRSTAALVKYAIEQGLA
jgi:two-component system nitrate/nitrite response regulator NarL